MLSNKSKPHRHHRHSGPAEITLLLDASGSMHERRSETIREVNRYLDSLRQDGNRYKLTVKTFNTYVDTLVHNKDIRDCGQLEHDEYRCDGWTALLDAVGGTLDSIGYGLDPYNRRTLFVVVTDGEENRSRNYGLHQVRDMIDRKRSDYFQFVFLGDGPGAWQAGRDLGFNYSVSTDWSNPQNSENIYRGLTAASTGFAKSGFITTASLNTNSTSAVDTTPVQGPYCDCLGVPNNTNAACPIHGGAHL